jgi:hypothetical protein
MLFESTQNKRRTIWFSAVGVALGAGALLLHAFNPQPDPPKVFGIFGITPVDVIRLHVTNVAGAVGVTGALPPPCRVQMGFVNADGALLKSADVSIPDGHSASLTLSFSEAGGAADALAPRTRANVRPIVLYAPPCFTAVSAEVADAIIGRTNIHATPESWPAAPALSTNTPQ